MTRIAIVIVVLCALAGGIYSSWNSYQKKAAELKRLEIAAGPFYFVAKRDLMVGAVIGEGDVNTIPIQFKPGEGRLKLDAFEESQKNWVIGRRVRYGLSKNQLIRRAHLMLP